MAVERQIIPKTILIAACTLVSRVLGLVRDVLVGAVFGTSAPLDMFIIAYTVPNLLRKLFGEGVLSAAFIPIFTRETMDPEKDETQLLRVVFTALTALLGALTFLGWLGCGAALWFMDLSKEGRLFCLLLAMMLPYMPLICMTALLGAALHTRDRFLAPAIAPALLNICLIVALLFFSDRFQVKALAGGVLLAGVLQFALLAPFVLRCGWRLRPLWNLAHPGLRRMTMMMLTVILGLGVTQVNVMLDRIIAEFCVPRAGANSALFFGNRLMQFPLGVLGLALVTAAFPAYARKAAAGDKAGLVETINMALRTALFLAFPCMAAIVALHTPIVRVVFERGEFDLESTARTARVLFYYGLGLAAFCVIHVLVRAFYALEEMKTPVSVAAKMVALNLTLNLTLVWSMREAGLALSSSISAVGNVALLAVLLRRRLGPLGGMRILSSAAKGAAAAMAGGMAGYFAMRAVAAWAGLTAGFEGQLSRQIISLMAGLVSTGGVFIVAAWLLRMEELHDFLRALVRRKAA